MSLAIMIPQISILINTIFLGNYHSSNGLVQSEHVLSVAGVAGIYYYVYAMIVFGLGSGMLIIMSRRAGEDDAQGVGKVFGAGFQLGLALVFFLLIICLLFSDYFFTISIQNNIVQSLAQDFIRIRIWGLPFLFIAHLGNMLFIAIDKTKFMMFGTLVETLIAVTLDYFLIFGNGPFPELGVEGAAIASVVAEVFMCTTILSIIFYNKIFKPFAIKVWNKVETAKFKEYFILSSPLMIQSFISIGSWEVFFIFVEHLGEHELGASQVVRSVYGIMGIAVWALASTANSMVSNLYGQKRYDDILPLLGKIVRICLGYAAVIGLLIFIFKMQIIDIYTNDVIIKKLAAPTMNVLIIASLIFSISLIYFNGMLGLGNTQRNLVYEILTISSYLIYCYIVVEVMRSTLWVAWTSEFVYWSVMLLFSAIYMHSKKWKPSLELTQ